MSDYRIARLDEMEEIDDGREPYRAVRHHLGITAFGVTAWTGREAGDRILNEHDEADTDTGDRNEELYLVLEGRARFELDGNPVDAAAGTFVFVEPAVRRTAFAEEAGTTIVAIGATAGKPYQAVGWELWSPIRPRYQAGEYEAVVEALRPLVDEHPRYPLLAYNLACVESLTGRRAEALAHLRQAIEGAELFRAFARNDTDLDAIRDEPAFAELVGDEETGGASRS
jgi:mannose-6-phosphate isomerase-like protein (cupin superfamily)